MALASPAAYSLKPLLEECGYTGLRLRENYRFGTTNLPLVGFAAPPWDVDSACIAVASGNGNSEAVARACRDMGAPIVWVRHNGTVDWWQQHDKHPTLVLSKPIPEFETLVRNRKSELHPLSVYRGKTIAQVDKSRQLDFVDVGLLPLLRAEAGNKLHDLVVEMTTTTLESLDERNPSRETLRRVFVSVFRLLAGKILRDKRVPGFISLDLAEPRGVLSLVTRHYGAEDPAGSSLPWLRALRPSSTILGRAGDFSAVSPEALAFVYENTLVTKSLRKKLGIHATPSWLVDYIVWNLGDWIRQIPEEGRHVFEPACGHAPFLLAAMRMLRVEASERGGSDAHQYLKSHIHGAEIDEFAREIARLSLTLADIPNPNGWDLAGGDMYSSDHLADGARNCGILLSNPPYEDFLASEKASSRRSGHPVHRTKAIELMNRTLPHLRAGAIFGFVLPQAFLHGAEAKETRANLLKNFEIREICLFADKVFEEGETESVVILGRRLRGDDVPSHPIRYRRVREDGVRRFASSYESDSETLLPASELGGDLGRSFLVPDLAHVWASLASSPRLSTVADVGQGFSFSEKGLLAEARRLATRRTVDAVPAFLGGHRDVDIWETPRQSWLSPSRTPIKPWRSGNASGRPQVVMNYVRAMRGPWRIKAFLDHQGRAAVNTYLTVRPKPFGPPIEFLWALLNSPLANAYVYCHTMQKHIYDGRVAKMPLPKSWEKHVNAVVEEAKHYLKIVERPSEFSLNVQTTAEARGALLAMDAAVLKAYGLPVNMERALLDLFRLPKQGQTRFQRKGVGCVFDSYYPSHLQSLLPLHRFISSGYRLSTVDRVIDRIRPGESEAVVAGLQAAVAAFKKK